jgi:hypothetical protein
VSTRDNLKAVSTVCLETSKCVSSDKVPLQDKIINQGPAKSTMREDSYSLYNKHLPKQGREVKLANKSIIKKAKSQNKTVYESTIVSISKDLNSRELSDNKPKVINTISSYNSVNNFVIEKEKELEYRTETESNEGLTGKLEGSLDNTMNSYYKGENNCVNLGSLLTRTNDYIYVFCTFDCNHSGIQ